MRVIEASTLPAHPVGQFGSVGFFVALAGAAVHAVVARLEPGGRIGRHPAVVDQALVVLAGDAVVSGHDDVRVEASVGQVVIWTAGEDHETHTSHGLTALILEAEGLGDAFVAEGPRS
ncbi:cupin [Intrasporangium oryzae NRRL B-24470]|uniref:Cupin n=1 Tax=Intrasporangium oryzae NRRL B-24470 TaxID=1386089 RepID=W9G7D6_9MICO|nr:hypothetical protein [Intrasporangium oryzae]EWT00733.1 cupin [Intrasporangium oryzae NRRL B-24470]